MLPDFETTARMFHDADVIVGAHGAGMANILLARPGATVIEIHCRGNETRWCFRLMALRLGMRYYASETTDTNVTFRCGSSGINVDMKELNKVLRFVASYLSPQAPEAPAAPSASMVPTPLKIPQNARNSERIQNIIHRSQQKYKLHNTRILRPAALS